MSKNRFSPAALLSRDGSIAAFAATAMVVWVLVEAALRRGAVPVLADPLGSARGADMLVVAVGFSLLAWGIARWGRRAGVGTADWDYERSLRAVGTGIAGVVAYFVGLIGFAAAYSMFVGAPSDSGASARSRVPAARSGWPERCCSSTASSSPSPRNSRGAV